MTTCRTCGAPVIWVKLEPNGKKNPLDAQPTGKAVVRFGPEGQFAKVVDTYESHFATCPNANEHRRKS